jgi:DNA polymerase-3 subunit delta'
MNFEGFLGNSRIKEYLSGCMENLTLPQALIITGARGIGKKTLAAIIAKALVCLSDNTRPCGVCGSCRKADSGFHPDIINVTAEDNKSSIGVEVARAVAADAYVLPNDGDRKVYVFKEAELLTHPAQDALLKILEDTPEFTFFIFICYNSDSLLETIRSRCTTLSLSPLGESDMRALLVKSFPDADKHELDKLVLKSNGIAGTVLREDGAETLIQHAARIAGALASKNELSILKAMISVEALTRAESDEVLSALKTILHDSLLFAYNPDGLTHDPTARDASRAVSESLTTEKILAVIGYIDAARQSINSNVGHAHIAGSLACRMSMAVL